MSVSESTGSQQMKIGPQRAAVCEHATVVDRILQLVGPGQQLYSAGIGRQWRSEQEQLWPSVPCCTSHLAVFASKSRLLLACSSDFRVILAPTAALLNDNQGQIPLEQWLQLNTTRAVSRSAGKHADLRVLKVAEHLGLTLIWNIIEGAVSAGAPDALQ